MKQKPPVRAFAPTVRRLGVLYCCLQINAVQRVFDEAEAAMGGGDLLGAIKKLDTLRGYPKTAVR